MISSEFLVKQGAVSNGNQPAQPTIGKDFTSQGVVSVTDCAGMTKRETIAMHIMAARISNPEAYRSNIEQHASTSVYAADALLEELERTK